MAVGCCLALLIRLPGSGHRAGRTPCWCSAALCTTSSLISSLPLLTGYVWREEHVGGGRGIFEERSACTCGDWGACGGGECGETPTYTLDNAHLVHKLLMMHTSPDHTPLMTHP